METALVAARKATPKGNFRIALARLTVSKTAPLGPCRSVLVLGRASGDHRGRVNGGPAGIRNNTLIAQQHTGEMLNLSSSPSATLPLRPFDEVPAPVRIAQADCRRKRRELGWVEWRG
jgi:hypothetical protein